MQASPPSEQRQTGCRTSGCAHAEINGPVSDSWWNPMDPERAQKAKRWGQRY
jgi:hypothetical protein